MTSAGVVAVAAAWVLTLVFGAWAVVRHKSPPPDTTAAVPDAYRQILAALEVRPQAQLLQAPMDPSVLARIAALEVAVQALPPLWREERERSEKARERARAYERSARAIASKSSEDGDDDGLSDDDEDGGGTQRMLPLPRLVGEPPPSRFEEARKALIQQALGSR